MLRKESEQHIASLSPQERIAAARHKHEELTDHVLNAITTDANNQFISFTDILSSQVPRSYAAHAFNDFQNSMFIAEVVRVCALWDPLDFDKVSVPTLYALLDDKAVLALLLNERLDHCRERDGHFADLGKRPMSPDLYESIRASNLNRDLERAERHFTKRSSALKRMVPKIIADDRLRDLRQFRHYFVAHNIGRKLGEPVDQERILPFTMPKMGFPRKLLRATCAITNAFDSVLNGSHFSFDETFEMAEENAKLLWENTTFTNLK